MNASAHTTPEPSAPDADLVRARELLPWHACGALDEEDRAFMVSWLQSHQEAQAELHAELTWWRSTAGLAQQAREQRAPDAGLADLMARIAASPAASPASRFGSPPRWQQRLSEWLARTLPPRGPALAFGAAALLLAQAGVIAVLLIREPAEQGALSGPGNVTVPADQALLTVAFKPGTSEQAIRALLLRTGARIFSGPSALGLYRLAVPKFQADAAMAALTAERGIVESVQRDR